MPPAALRPGLRAPPQWHLTAGTVDAFLGRKLQKDLGFLGSVRFLYRKRTLTSLK